MPVLGRQPGTQAFRSVEEYPDGEMYRGLLVMRSMLGVFFASSDALEDRLRELAQDAETRFDTIIVSFEGVGFIDSHGSAKISEILGLAETYGAEVLLARVRPETQLNAASCSPVVGVVSPDSTSIASATARARINNSTP